MTRASIRHGSGRSAVQTDPTPSILVDSTIKGGSCRRTGRTLAYHLQRYCLGLSPHRALKAGATAYREDFMDRRSLLNGLAGAGGLAFARGLSAPALAQGAAARTLRFVPQANLANFDPIWGTQYVVRNAAALVWDTLYGFDSTLQPQRQMVEAEEVSDDGLI